MTTTVKKHLKETARRIALEQIHLAHVDDVRSSNAQSDYTRGMYHGMGLARWITARAVLAESGHTESEINDLVGAEPCFMSGHKDAA